MRNYLTIIGTLFVLFLWSACGPARLDTEQVEGYRWELTHYAESESVLAEADEIEAWLQLTNGQLSGYTGCNRLQGAYAWEGDMLVTGPLSTTKRACLDIHMREQYFLGMLEDQPTASLQGGVLTLTSAQGRLVFSKGEAVEVAPVEVDTVAVAAQGKAESAAADYPDWPDTTDVLHGMFAYMADAAIFVNCADGKRYPVAMEAGYLPLERKYTTEMAEEAGKRVLLTATGSIAPRPTVDGEGEVPTLVVKQMLSLSRDASCDTERLLVNGALSGGNLRDCVTGDIYSVRWLTERPFEGNGFIKVEGIVRDNALQVIRVVGWQAAEAPDC